MLAVYKKELKSYFTSVIACLFIAVTTLIAGIFFVYYNLNNGLTNMYAVYECLFILVFTVPILTMRIIADERRQKTDQLILTAPVTVGKIVLGKFFALVTIFAIPVFIMCLYPLILSAFGDMTFGIAYTNILGLFLYGISFIAIGMFISSVTESQVISAILSIVVLLLGYLMGSLTSMISSEGNILTKILGAFDLYSPMQNFLNGMIKISDIIYYLSVVLLFLFLTCQSIQKRRWDVSKKTIGTGVFSGGMIAIIVAITVFVNLIAGIVSEKSSWASIDVTSQKLFSISEKTENMLAKLDTDITLYVMSSESAMDDTVKKTLDRYKMASDHIKVEYKDTTRYPNFYQEFTDTAPSGGSIIVYNEKTKKSKVVDYSEIYVTDSSSYYYTGQSTASSYDCEGQLDTAIAYVRTENSQKIYQVEGHDEAVLDSTNFGTSSNLTDIIEKYNCEVESIKLVNKEEKTVDECAAVLLLGPEKDYTKEEAQVIIDYLNAGGSAIVALENTTSMGVDKPNFYSILKEYNVEVLDGIIAENDASYYSPQYGPFYAFAEGITGYASGLTSYVFTPYTAGIKEGSNTSDDIVYTALAGTSSDAVLKTDAMNSETYEKEKGDKQGPFDTVACVTITTTKKGEEDEDSDETEVSSITSNLLVFGSVYSLSDTMDEYVQGSNTQVVNNALSEYIDTDVDTISVPAKSMETTQLNVTESGSRWFGILISIVVPVIVLIGGIGVWVRRRKY